MASIPGRLLPCGLRCLGNCHGLSQLEFHHRRAWPSFCGLSPSHSRTMTKAPDQQAAISAFAAFLHQRFPSSSPFTAKVSVLQLDLFHHLRPSITVELIGSYTARHVETGLTVDLTKRRNRNTTKGPISPLCRKLLDLGNDPETRVHVVRNVSGREQPMTIFKRDRSLKTWAACDCVESDTASLRVKKWTPLPSAVKAFREG